MKIPIAFMRSFNVRLIIYMDDILVIERSLEEIMMPRGYTDFHTTESGSFK